MRFDPYTGEPINDDAPDNNSTKEVTTNQDPVVTPDNSAEANQSSFTAPEPGTGTAANVERDDYGRVTPPQPEQQPQSNTYSSQGQYNTNNQGSYNAQNNYNPYGNPGNPQGQTYNPYNGQPTSKPVDIDARANSLGTAALVCGIISIVFSFASACCCPIITLGTGIAAIICAFFFSSTLSGNSSNDNPFKDYFEKNYNYDFGTDSNIKTAPSVTFDDITVR